MIMEMVKTNDKKGLDSSVLSSNYMKLKSAIPRNKTIKQNCSFLL